MQEKHYVKIKKWIDDSIKLNINCRKENENKERTLEWLGLQSYHNEIATVKLCLGRNTGKTKYIVDYLASNKDAIAFVNVKINSVFKPVKEKVFTLNKLNVESTLQDIDLSKIKKVFIDDATWFDNIDLVYQLLSKDNIERTFILLG